MSYFIYLFSNIDVNIFDTATDGSDFKRISKYTEKVKINSTLLDLHNFQIYSDRGRTISLKLL